MMKSKLMKAVILGTCMALFSSTTAFAAEKDEALPEETYQIAITSTEPDQLDNIGSDILDKQKEIDKYLFEDHAKEIADQGIQITHTAPTENYVEIGILPFNKENEDYLYNLFGKDKVKVIEGVEVMTMMADDAVQTTAATTDTVTDAAKTGESNFPTVPVSIAGILVVVSVFGGSIVIDRKRKAEKR